MNFKAIRNLQFYYTFILLVAFGVFLFGVKYFWENCPFNVDNLNATFESSLHFDELKRNEYIKHINQLVNEDKSREAILKLNEFEKRTNSLNRINNIESFKPLLSSFNEIKKSLNELISFPQMSNVIIVLNNKISSFQGYVSKNNWRTLTRISKRMRNRLSGRAIQTPGFFTYKKLNEVMALTQKDINLLEKITTSSVLKKNDKQNILSKMKTFRTEHRMLKKYLVSMKKFSMAKKKIESRYKSWFKDLAPQITLTKINMQNDTKAMVFSLLGMGTFLFLSVIFGFFIYGSSKNKQSRDFGSSFFKLVNEGIFPIESKVDTTHFNEKFDTEFTKCREYFHKRISFGTVFQEAVPFSSILLDSNLNLTWANELFYEHWRLDDTHRERHTVTWDFLQQYTNLGEDDPVLMALNQGIAGIYQIQVKDAVTSESLPYEMYVSPVEYSKQKRIMIFFYPLRSLEETIANQAKSIVGPVRNILDSFIQNSFNVDTKNKLSKDFDIAGIGELYSKFLEFNKINNEKEENFKEEISVLESTLADKSGLIEAFDTVNDNKIQVESHVKSNFSEMKAAIVQNIDLRYELEKLYNFSLTITKQLIKKKEELLFALNKTKNIVEENNQAFGNVNKVREDFKTIRASIDDTKARLNQSLEQTLLFVKKDTNVDPRLEGSIGKLRLEVRGVEQMLQNFSKVIRSLDVGIGKMELISQQCEIPRCDTAEEDLRLLSEKFESNSFEFERLGRSGQKTDEIVIESLKSLYDCFRLTEELTLKSSDMIDKFYKESESCDVVFLESKDITEESSAAVSS